MAACTVLVYHRPCCCSSSRHNYNNSNNSSSNSRHLDHKRCLGPCSAPCKPSSSSSSNSSKACGASCPTKTLGRCRQQRGRHRFLTCKRCSARCNLGVRALAATHAGRSGQAICRRNGSFLCVLISTRHIALVCGCSWVVHRSRRMSSFMLGVWGCGQNNHYACSRLMCYFCHRHLLATQSLRLPNPATLRVHISHQD